MDGKIFVISSPSGAGKTSLARELMKIDRNICFSVSNTTREMRPGEIDGIDYFFTTKEEFLKKVESGEFFEYTMRFGNMYGTNVDQVTNLQKTGKDILFDVDHNGTIAIKQSFNNVVTIFIMPPSLEILKERMKKRGDTDLSVDLRMLQAEISISQKDQYDHVIVNDDFQDSLDKLMEIVKSERETCTKESHK